MDVKVNSDEAKSDVFVLNGDLNRIEEQLKMTVQTSDPLVNGASLHLLEAGGKRIRPVLFYLVDNLAHIILRK